MHVLVVEDEPRVAHVVKRALEQDAHVVDVAYDGVDGFDKAHGGDFDVVVLDVLLPGMNGLEVCRKLRHERVHTPVLMLTARDAIDQRVSGLDSGADDYLTKPFAVAELQARVRALGRRRNEVTDEVLTTADLELSLARREVKRDGRVIDLTNREFALLEYLLRNKGHALSRQQLLDSVWGYDFTSETNVVDIYIHYLRNKIDKRFGQKLIRTVRGVGYGIKDL